MRTTVTIDQDVAVEIEKVMAKRKMRFKDLINDALRLGLRQLLAQNTQRTQKYRTASSSLGRCLLPSLDNVAEILATTEGEDYK